MNTIKGLVLLTRFDYIEHLYGRKKLTEFVDALNVEDKNQLIQPTNNFKRLFHSLPKRN